ncbi:ATP-binding protein [Allopontixanthobacter sediminis]|uniref:ATP-binding protein n=1 Tax=Allopontixanthobacter sediminis TaxID=1689985 RepID=UPI0038B73A6B
MLLHRLSKLHERTSVIMMTNLSFSECWDVFGTKSQGTRLTSALLDQQTHRCHIPGTGNDRFPVITRSADPKIRTEQVTGRRDPSIAGHELSRVTSR